MPNRADEFSERLLDFGVKTIKISVRLQRNSTGRQITNQLLRSGTSAGANYEEARGAQSRADFLHKLHISLKEIRESLYWLKLIDRAKILSAMDLNGLIDEAQQISNIIAKSIITMKEKG